MAAIQTTMTPPITQISMPNSGLVLLPSMFLRQFVTWNIAGKPFLEISQPAFLAAGKLSITCYHEGLLREMQAMAVNVPTADRLARFSESVIREMTRVANRYGAINLSQGFPDFDPPQELVQAAKEALQGEYHQYAITWGQPEFREALAAKQSRLMGLPLDPNEHFVVTCGGTEAMLVAIR